MQVVGGWWTYLVDAQRGTQVELPEHFTTPLYLDTWERLWASRGTPRVLEVYNQLPVRDHITIGVDYLIYIWIADPGQITLLDEGSYQQVTRWYRDHQVLYNIYEGEGGRLADLGNHVKLWSYELDAKGADLQSLELCSPGVVDLTGCVIGQLYVSADVRIEGRPDVGFCEYYAEGELGEVPGKVIYCIRDKLTPLCVGPDCDHLAIDTLPQLTGEYHPTLLTVLFGGRHYQWVRGALVPLEDSDLPPVTGLYLIEADWLDRLPVEPPVVLALPSHVKCRGDTDLQDILLYYRKLDRIAGRKAQVYLFQQRKKSARASLAH